MKVGLRIAGLELFGKLKQAVPKEKSVPFIRKKLYLICILG